jgi:general secretion pathway protein D
LSTLATKTDFTLLSSPQVLVLNNETATVNVGDQVPVETSTTQTGTGDTSVSVDKTIQYKDTGVILEVTPQINYNGVILLDIKQTISKAIPTTTGVESSATIQTRELKTKLAVKDGQSIMIGGLIQTNDDFEESGVPLLKDIPLFGYLFKYQKTTIDKTELLIMVTPYVIETEDVLDQYIKEFEHKMSGLRESLYPVETHRLTSGISQ